MIESSSAREPQRVLEGSCWSFHEGRRLWQVSWPVREPRSRTDSSCGP